MVVSVSGQTNPSKITSPEQELENLEADNEQLLGENQSLRAEINAKIPRLHELAAARYAEGNYREAQTKMKLAYDVFQRIERDDNQARLRYLRLLCNASNALGEIDETIQYAIEIAIHAEGNEDRAIACNALGLAYEAKGDLGKAIKYHEKSLALRVKALGPSHAGVAVTCNNLGNTYRAKGQYEVAIEYYEQSEAIHAKAFELEHPDMAITYNNLGEVYRAKEEYQTAILYYRKSLAIKSKLLGRKHPGVVITSTNLADVCLRWGIELSSELGSTNALDHLLEAKKIYSLLNPKHPKIADVFFHLGSLHLLKGNSQLARENLLNAKILYLTLGDRGIPEARRTQLMIDGIE